CVEAEVKRRALGLLTENRPDVCTFQLDSDYGWDDGLICGGRMKIIVEPIAAGSRPVYFQRLAEVIERGEGCTEALVFDGEASGIAAPTALVCDREGRLRVGIRHRGGGPGRSPGQARAPRDRPGR